MLALGPRVRRPPLTAMMASSCGVGAVGVTLYWISNGEGVGVKTRVCVCVCGDLTF